MTISKALDVENSNLDYTTEYFPLEKMNPDDWTFIVTDKGITGIDIVDKKYGLWKDVIKQNNIGRFKGTNPHKVKKIRDDIEQNGVDSGTPPVFIDIETGDIITGGHRHDASGLLGNVKTTGQEKDLQKHLIMREYFILLIMIEMK
jgi:hypothetical protein